MEIVIEFILLFVFVFAGWSIFLIGRKKWKAGEIKYMKKQRFRNYGFGIGGATGCTECRERHVKGKGDGFGRKEIFANLDCKCSCHKGVNPFQPK